METVVVSACDGIPVASAPIVAWVSHRAAPSALKGVDFGLVSFAIR